MVDPVAKPLEETESGEFLREGILPPQSSSHGKPGRLLRCGSDLRAAEALRAVLEQQHQEVLQRFDLQAQQLSKLQKLLPTASARFAAGVVEDGDGPRSMPALAIPASRQRRQSFTPLRFQTFEEEENKRREAALHESQIHSSMERTNSEPLREGFLTRLVKSNHFEMFFTCVVLTNSIFIGIDVQLSTQSPEDTHWAIQVVQYMYTALFTIELLLRLSVHGRSFFCSPDWLWNWLDIFIVATSLWEVSIDVVAGILGAAAEYGSVEGMTGLRAFRIIRVTRIAKTVRLLHIFRFILALRMLVTSIINTLKSLLWALILLILIIYVFAVLFAQAVASYLADGPVSDLEEQTLIRYYGSLWTTMLHLFMSISGGISWVELINPLEQISLAWVLLFLFFISFTYFAVLNVVTAVFCQSAIEGAQNDHAAKVQSVLADKQAHLEKVRTLFSKFGADDGVITFGIFEDKINSPAVKEYFATLGLEVYDAWSFFKMLDVDGGGAVEIEEFLLGCLRLRGQATAMDVAKVMNDISWLIKSQGQFHAYVEVELKHLKDDLFGRASVTTKSPSQPED
ncbi:CACNA1H [Symbiodinium sp. KB8]|nr:CACNA1H [Symbiodinium sp. KB8]